MYQLSLRNNRLKFKARFKKINDWFGETYRIYAGLVIKIEIFQHIIGLYRKLIDVNSLALKPLRILLERVCLRVFLFQDMLN